MLKRKGDPNFNHESKILKTVYREEKEGQLAKTRRDSRVKKVLGASWHLMIQL